MRMDSRLGITTQSSQTHLILPQGQASKKEWEQATLVTLEVVAAPLWSQASAQMHALPASTQLKQL